MTEQPAVHAEEVLRAEIGFLDGEIAALQKRKQDLSDLLGKGIAAPPSSSQPRPSSPPANDAALVKAAAAKVEWKSKNGGDGWFWAFANERDGSRSSTAGELVDVLKKSGAKKIGDGEYDYTLSSDGKFLNKAKVKKP